MAIVEHARETPRPINALFDQILLSHKKGECLDPLPFMREILDTLGTSLTTTSEAVIDPTKPLIFAPNHYHNPQLARTSTVEAMKNISIVTVGAANEKLFDGHTAWFIKIGLSTYFIPGRKARMVHNSASSVFNYIGVKVGKNKIGNLPDLIRQYNIARERGSAIGYFPEQAPTTALTTHHENLPVFLGFTQGLFQDDVQVVPVSVWFTHHEAKSHYGETIILKKSAGKHELSEFSYNLMKAIAANLPPKLRGPYA